MKKFKNRYDFKINNKLGQTAMELAVFGSIFVFTMGFIVRTALAYGYHQGQSFKAMRMAMKMSYMYSSGQMGSTGDNNASRNAASVFLIEDRLSSSSAKYGTVDRVPYMIGGSAVHSRNLFLPVDDGETHNLGVSDYWINGVHFPFSSAKFVTKGGFNAAHPDWDPNCAVNDLTSVPVGCVVVYEKIPNHPGVSAWDPNCALCFDLDRDGTIDVPAAPVNFRPYFSWQWQRRHAIVPVPGITFTGVDSRRVPSDERFSADVDGDGKEETVYSISGTNAEGVVTSMRVIDFQEGDVDTSWQEGDLDGAGNPIPQPGIQRDVEVLTFLRGQRAGEEGTYAIVEEGRLYGGGRQFIRTVRKKDQVDIIQREIQLSNWQHGRFCNADLSRPGTVSDDAVPNPVEKCVNTQPECFTQANIAYTCMAVDDAYIFVRSRIADRRGRKWVTDTTDEHYVEMLIPGTP